MSGSTADPDNGISQTGASPWIRHPTDVGIYGTPYTNYITFELSARVARRNLVTVNAASDFDKTLIGTTAGTTNAVDTCLTCHKAHASQYNDSLRFTYEDMLTGAGGTNKRGCLACHNDK